MAKSNKKSIKRLSLLLGALTLGTIFLVSYTLARFTTSASSSGSSGVSTWDITITPQTNTTPPDGTTYDGAVSFGKLSPGPANTDPANNSPFTFVSNTTDKLQIATLSYETDVDFILSVEASDYIITFSDNSTLTYNISSGDVSTDSASGKYAYTVVSKGSNPQVTNNTSISSNDAITAGSTDSYTPTASEITGLYNLNVYYSTSSTATDSMSSLGDGVKFTASNSDTTYYFYADLTWEISVTKYSSSTINSYYWVTYLCDWVGKYVDTVSCTLTYTADQASETPN